MATRYRFGDSGIPHFILLERSWACADNGDVVQYLGLEIWVFKRDLSDPLEHLNQGACLF